MSARSTALATRFESASRLVSTRIALCAEQDLSNDCPAESCNVVALACHVARVHEVAITWISALLQGESIASITMEEIDRNNQNWARIDATQSRAAALELLATNRESATAFVRSLSDQDLDTTGEFGPFNGSIVSVQTLIEQILIGDPLNHVRSIDAALSVVATD